MIKKILNKLSEGARRLLDAFLAHLRDILKMLCEIAICAIVTGIYKRVVPAANPIEYAVMLVGSWVLAFVMADATGKYIDTQMDDILELRDTVKEALEEA